LFAAGDCNLGLFDSTDRQDLANIMLRERSLASYSRCGANRDQTEGFCQSGVVSADLCYVGQADNWLGTLDRRAEPNIRRGCQ